MQNSGDAVYFEHHPAAVFAKDLVVVVASLAVAQREGVGLPEKAKPDYPEQAVSVTSELTLGIVNRMMEIGLGNWALEK